MKLVIFILSIFTLHLCLGQTDLIKTNIDPSYLKPKWMDDYLKTSVFRDGTELTISNDIAFWGKSNNPTVFITKNNDYLYNHYAIMEKKGICPIGYKVPDFKELINSKIEIVRSKKFSQNDESSESNKIRSTPYILQFLDDDFIYSTPTKEVYLATSTNSESIYEFTSAIINLDSKMVEEWPLYNNSGVAIKCIEDFNESLKSKEVEYNILLPFEFNRLENTLTDLMTNYKTKNFYFSGKLQFDENGKNVSNSFGAIDDMENLSLYNEIKNTISNWTVYPYYNNLKIKTSHNFRINVNSNSYTSDEKRMLSKNSYLNYYFKDYSLRNMLDNCDEGKKDFKFKIEKIKYKITIDNELIQNSLNSTIKKVIGKGPFYSLYSVLPGLGKIQITSDSKISKDVGFNRKTNSFLGISISLGVIGGVSKLISHYHYEVYRQGLSYEDLSRNYKIANISQKVFLSCLTAYSAMFLYDFSSTLALGIGNKTLQRKINKKIRKLENPIILN